jgi:chemotaxis protein methyltransferase CheR
MSLTKNANTRHVVFAPARREFSTAINFAPARTTVIDPAESAQRLGEDQWFINWLMRQAGLSALSYRPLALHRRLPAVLRTLRVPTLSLAKSAIQNEPSLLAMAVDALVLGVTRFFRDSEVFAAIESRVLTELCRGGDRPRIWSVGCGSGAELYSVAILLAERQRVAGACLLGTDCRQSAIDAAAAGQYSQSVVSGMAPALLSRYFKHEAPNWTLDANLIGTCQWRRSNVLRQGGDGAWDMILCRNMAMYLTPEAAHMLWRRLALSLRSGGFLVVGRAERPGDAVRLNMLDTCIYQKAGG